MLVSSIHLCRMNSSDSSLYWDQVGEFDPITREPLDESQLISNLAIKEAVHAFLDKHGWAYRTDWRSIPFLGDLLVIVVSASPASLIILPNWCSSFPVLIYEIPTIIFRVLFWNCTDTLRTNVFNCLYRFGQLGYLTSQLLYDNARTIVAVCLLYLAMNICVWHVLCDLVC